MNTHRIADAIELLGNREDKEEARKEFKELKEKLAEQELRIAVQNEAFKSHGIGFPAPDYDSLSEVAKAELRAAAKCPRAWGLPYDETTKGKPGDVTAVHDDQMDAMVYSFNSMVNHPKHYNKGKYEVIDIIESILESMELTPVEAMLTAQVVKYIARWKNKNGVEDLKKAEWYLRRLIG
jgi:hypothetical protein